MGSRNEFSYLSESQETLKTNSFFNCFNSSRPPKTRPRGFKMSPPDPKSWFKRPKHQSKKPQSEPKMPPSQPNGLQSKPKRLQEGSKVSPGGSKKL